MEAEPLAARLLQELALLDAQPAEGAVVAQPDARGADEEAERERRDRAREERRPRRRPELRLALREQRGRALVVSAAGQPRAAPRVASLRPLLAPGRRRQLTQLFREQLSVYTSDPTVVGAFYWTLRMGSGWDPRPTAAAPRGAQAPGSSAWRSRQGYPFAVWSLLEMAHAGIVPRMDAAAVAGACHGV